MRNLQFTFSLVLCLCVSSLFAQTDSTEVVDVKPQTAVKKAQPDSVKSVKIVVKSGPQIYLDYGKLLLRATEFESKFEAGVAYTFGFRLQPNFQYGIATLEPATAIENGEYKSEGSYWRVGINYIIPFDNTNTFYAGVKYGQSKFEDSGSYLIESEYWPTYTDGFERKGLEADWFELVLGSEKKMSDNVFIGGMFGLRFIYERSKEEFIDIYAIPGYGRTTDKSTPYVNLYVKYRF